MKKTGFTLIELLIVIAIILILIAIALPNFLEAQIRAKVTKALGDMRSMSTALHSYYLDFAIFPPDHDPDDLSQRSLFQLTTPIAYMGLIPEDPFSPPGTGMSVDEIGWEMGSTASELRIQFLMRTEFNSNIHAFALTSHGPDVGDNSPDDYNCNDDWPFCGRAGSPCDPNSNSGGRGWMEYSATNGTKSNGELVEAGGEHRTGLYCINGWEIISGRYPPQVP